MAEPRTKILLVEDNQDSAAALAELLRLDGYEVSVSHSVASALEQAAHGFDVLVTDIGLPDGSGRDLMRKLSVARPVRGIALTGYGSESDKRLDTEAGFGAHITKPVDAEHLLATLRTLTRTV